MHRVTVPVRHRRSRFRVLAAALLASVQFGVVAFGPLVDSADGLGAPAHVEETGIRLHYSHNPDNCAACAASTLVGDAPRGADPSLPRAVSDAPLRADIRVAPRRLSFTPKAPRAPPRALAAR